LKILKILNSHDGGGVFTCERQFINHWKNTGIQIDAIIVGKGKAYFAYKGLVNDAIEFPEMEITSNGSKIYNVIINLIESRRFVYSNKHIINTIKHYDAVIYRKNYFDYFASLVGKICAGEVYWHMPLSVSNVFEKFYYNYILKKNITPIANSIYTMNTIGNICKEYVYPGFDIDRTSVGKKNGKLREIIGINSEALVLGIAARIKRRKAQHLVIESTIELLSDYPDLHLIIAGEPLDSAYARKCLKLSENFQDNIHFVGFLEDISDFYSSIDLYINSRLDAEPFGISIAEAMGSSLPVIALKLGGPSEMIKDNINGWLIDNPTKLDYLKTIKKAIQNKNRWIEMGKISKILSYDLRAEINADKFLNIIKNRHYILN
jgi:glycosyltransferase involved in cell wall biosynthesis